MWRIFLDKLKSNLKERSLKQLALMALPVVLVLFLAFWFWHGNHNGGTGFRTMPVTRGDLLSTISATGTVEPEEVVDIGAQVAGRIVAFGKDRDGKTVDYGSRVEAGTVLAKIDDSLYAADVSSAKAAVAQAKANLKRAEADLGQLKAKLFQADRDWMRAQKLGPSDALSQSDYCTIRSPVRGVVVDRRVNIGQTVVASLNAPSLFLLAKDLKRLQVWAAVNEADIGNIHPGQPVNFTVDAYPGITFKGEVSKVRLNATMTQNVVTYTVEISTDNSDGKLIPYLTANLRFLVAEKKNVLLVPNAALRWTPLPNQIAPEFRAPPKKKEGRRDGAQKTASKRKRNQATGTLWVMQSNYVKPLKIRLGPTDGSFTEILGSKLKEGTQLVVGERQQSNGSEGADSSSPFTPQFFRKK
jgi:HlyD family secretion protein